MKSASRARWGVVAAMIVASIVSCRGVIGIEEQTFVPDSGASEGGTADSGTDTGSGVDGGDLASIVAACRNQGPSTCKSCCATSLASALVELKKFVGEPTAGACTCGGPEAGVTPACGQQCGGIQDVCPGSPAGPSTPAQCEACLLGSLVSDQRCQDAEQVCTNRPACKPIVTCLSQCP